jgi:hypothetical protein
MPSRDEHIALAMEKLTMMQRASDEEKMSVVADLAVKAVEQALQAYAAIQHPPQHFRGSAAHGDLRNFARKKFSHTFSEELNWLYSMYERLGYEGSDKGFAKRVVNITYALLEEVGKKIGFKFEKPTVG